MKAAVVTSFAALPRYAEVAEPTAAGPDEFVVEVLAAGLHPRVRSQANGSHYTSDGALPLVPGVDGVGRDAEGELRYFVLADTTVGSMAERTVIDRRRSIVLPSGVDPVLVAAAMNPAMSSWVALRRRIQFMAGETVLVLGATGSAGRMAVEVARLLGAGRVVGAGRNVERLAELAAADVATVTLGEAETAERLAAVAADVDVVLDYVWGEPTAIAMTAIVTARPERGRPLSWVEIGSLAGATAPIPSAALRAARLEIVGSGQGSVGGAEIVAELPALVDRLVAGDLTVEPVAVPLRDVERAWAEPSDRRVVLVP